MPILFMPHGTLGLYGPFQPLPVVFVFYLADARKLHPQFWIKEAAAYLQVFYGIQGVSKVCSDCKLYFEKSI